MAHITVRHRQTKEGLKWIATEAIWNNAKNTCTEKKIDEIALQALGFSSNMTPEQAKSHAKKLNALKAIERKEQASKIKAGERLTDLIVIENSIVPEVISNSFVSYMENNWYGGPYNLRKQVQHWNFVQKIITELKIQPHEYCKKQKDFYKYFQKNKMSKSYVEKLLKVINMWGEYYSDQSRTYFKKLPNPKGVALQAIIEASNADGQGAAPLTLETLRTMKLKMPEEQWNYLRATLWLGLRPSELDLILKDKSKYKITSQEDIKILGVYQAKLTGVSKEKRWKYIPLFHDEQKAALSDIEHLTIKKPLLKTIKKAAKNDKKVGLYSGRKGFTDLMLSLNQTLENIALWMGHSSIERTWKHYKTKDIIKYNPILKEVL